MEIASARPSVPGAWKARSEKRLEGKVKDLKGVDEQLEKEHEWPEYWLGAYPYSFCPAEVGLQGRPDDDGAGSGEPIGITPTNTEPRRRKC